MIDSFVVVATRRIHFWLARYWHRQALPWALSCCSRLPRCHESSHLHRPLAGKEIASIALREEYAMFEEALAIYKKFSLHPVSTPARRSR